MESGAPLDKVSPAEQTIFALTTTLRHAILTFAGLLQQGRGRAKVSDHPRAV